MESRHTSRYYVWRQGRKRLSRYAWPKLSIVCHLASHLWAGAVVSPGPSQDSPQFPDTVIQAVRQIDFDCLLGDAAYDGEHNHVLCRKLLGIRSTVIALNKRRGRKWPTSIYRRQMKRRFPIHVYHQRWQVESGFSRHKRRLGSALRARRDATQHAEILLRVLTHNLLILRLLLPRVSTEH